MLIIMIIQTYIIADGYFSWVVVVNSNSST